MKDCYRYYWSLSLSSWSAVRLILCLKLNWRFWCEPLSRFAPTFQHKPRHQLSLEDNLWQPIKQNNDNVRLVVCDHPRKPTWCFPGRTIRARFTSINQRYLLWSILSLVSHIRLLQFNNYFYLAYLEHGSRCSSRYDRNVGGQVARPLSAQPVF